MLVHTSRIDSAVKSKVVLLFLDLRYSRFGLNSLSCGAGEVYFQLGTRRQNTELAAKQRLSIRQAPALVLFLCPSFVVDPVKACQRQP